MAEGKRKILKRILILLLILIITGGTAIFSIQYFKGDRINQMLVSELNKHLATEVSSGGMEISLFKSFPYASVIFRNIEMKAPAGFSEAPGLINAREIIFRFNIISFITGHYTIHSISIDNASITFYEDGFGRTNYDVIKKNGNTGKGNVDFDIQKLTITSSKVYFKNLRRNDDIAIAVSRMQLKGSMQDEQFTLKLKGDLFNERLILSGETIVPAGPATAESVIDINTTSEILDFKKSNLIYSEIPVEFQGKYAYGDNASIDFLITSLRSDIGKIMHVIPAWVSEIFKPYNPAGDINFKGSIKGPAGNPVAWTISASGEVSNGRLSYTENKLDLTGIESEIGFYYAGKETYETLNLKSFSGNIGSGRFKGNAVIRNFSKPVGTLFLNINTDLNELKNLIENDYVKDPVGKLIADINYKGPFEGSDRIDKSISGEATFTDAGFQYSKQQVSELNGSVKFREDKLVFDGLTSRIGETDLKANGYINNLVSSFLGDKQNIHASLTIYSEKLKLEDILGLVEPSGSKTASTSIFPPNITFTALLSVDKLTYKKLNTNSITGSFSLQDDILRGRDISIKALGGNITADGLINGRYGNKAQIVSRAVFRGVDINQMFYQFNDFGQTSLISSNLKGTADASVDFATTLFSDFTVNTESIEAIADVEIREGELNDFEPLQALSMFLDAKELRNVKFATLRNRIEITRKTVLIPKMEIQSSAMNLIGYGTHTFGNDIDYHVNMLLSDVLRAKKKKHDAVEQFVEDDGYGKPRLFLKLSGPIDDPVVKYDTKAVGRKIADDFKNEKKVFKDVIRQEFGRKTTEPEKDPKKAGDKQSPEFQIEWDEIK